MDAKLKPGDRVRVQNSGVYDRLKSGSLGTVKQGSNTNYYSIEVDDYPEELFILHYGREVKRLETDGQPYLPGTEPSDQELQAIWRALEEIEESKEGLITSDGGSTSYYTLPDHATELRHLISAKGMSKSRGDIFKACYRLGQKKGADVAYDLKKMKFFIDDLIEMHERGEHL